MKKFINKWSNWWILNPKRKQLDEAFEKELNELIEREVALRQCNVMVSDCDHEWLDNSFDQFGFLKEQICDKCGAKQSVP